MLPSSHEKLHEVLTVSEVAETLRCSKAHVHNLIAGRVRGKIPLPALHLGRRSLVRRSSLTAWIELSESETATIRSSPNIDAADA
jgi:excisionase family DNA binding protein